MKIKNIPLSIIISFIVFSVLSLYATFYSPKSPLLIESGVADYSNFSFGANDTYSINELFYEDASVNTPGYTCYRLNILLPDNVKDLGIRIPPVYSDFLFYIDGKLCYSNTLNTTSDISSPKAYPSVIFAKPNNNNSVELKMYVKEKSFIHSLAFVNPINTNDMYIGLATAVGDSQKTREIINTLVIIACIISAIYQLMSSRYKSGVKSHIYLSVFSFSIAICLLFNSQATIHYFIPTLSYTFYVRIYLFASLIKLGALFSYLYNSANDIDTFNIPMIFIFGLFFVLIASIFTVPINYLYFMYAAIIILSALVMIIGIVTFLDYFIKDYGQKRSDIVVGLSAMMYGLYTEYLYLFGSHSYYSHFSITQLFFMLLQSFTVARYYHDSLAKIKTVSPKLHNSLNELQNNPSTYINTHIKPSYLYETLDAINNYIDTDTEKVDRLIQSLAKYLRQALDFSINPTKYSLKKEIDNCYAYTYIVNEHHPEIKITFNVSEDIPDTYIPQQAILSIIDNSIQKAFTGILQPAINIDVCNENDYISISITDNGIGMSEEEIEHELTVPSKNFNIGLYYINNQLISNFDSKLIINSQPRKGTSVSFKIPIVEVEEYV